jgi:aminoglycoside/choline kinase family phosphotransferase
MFFKGGEEKNSVLLKISYTKMCPQSSPQRESDEKHLVHGDFDPTNILLDKINGSWVVAGILGWEFAFSGSCLWDVANMLRYAHKMPPEFQNSLLDALQRNGIKLPPDWRITAH